MDEIGYVYKKKIYEQLNREYFPFYKFNDYMNKTKKIKNKKRNLTDYYILETINKNKTEINDYNEHMIPNHYQNVELKGIKNQTYGIRYDNKPNYFSFHNISLRNKNEQIFNNFNNYLMRNNVINTKKHGFKV